MGIFEHFFLDSAVTTPHLYGTHDLGLVILSLCVSIFSATMALQTSHIAGHTENPLYQHVAIATGAIALGGGIWTTHFIGMLAFKLPTQVHYSVGLTLLSLLPACAASWFALRILAHRDVTWPQLLIGGTLVGLGIGAMHYSGMAAMQTPLQMRYEPTTFVLSIFVAVGLAILALWVRYGLRQFRLGKITPLLIGGTVMGLAIASMHYTGMAAVRFIGEPTPVNIGLTFDTTFASLALSTCTIAITLLAVALNGLIRTHELYHQVEEGQSRLSATLDTAADGIITINSQGLIQSFNHSAERLFGWTAQEVMGHNIKMLMPEPDQSRHDGYLHNYLHTGEAKIIGQGREVTGLRKDGSLLPMRLAVGRVPLPDELLFVGFLSDISERKALENSLRETAERAERAAEAKGTFLANMSHEIRTPMNSIIGFTELLLQDNLSSRQRNHLDTIRQSSRSLLNLINGILDTTKMEQEALLLEITDFSLKELAQQVESSLRLTAQAKQLTLTTHYPADMPEYFKGDPLRVLQVLNNLIGNATKFTEQGGVNVRFSFNGQMIHIQVEDTGIGMTPQQVETIFAPFSQADASISRRFGGTGLGMTIASQLVGLLDGRIHVDSELGCGSTFHVWLPLPLGQPPTANEAAAQLPALPPLTVLIADDVPQNLELLSLVLNNQGHQTVATQDGNAALQAFKDGHFDLVLMDVHMPETDGLQATRLIRQHERIHDLPPTPVIALTASVLTKDRDAAYQAGMNGFASKPLDPPRLLKEMARVLGINVATPVTTAASTADSLAPAIDWARGISLWGSREHLIKRLQQFLATVAENHPLPPPTADEVDWQSTLKSLHSIRGATGNLALPSISELAGQLEALVESKRYQEARAGLAQLHVLLSSVTQHLANNAPLADENPTTTPSCSGPALTDMHALLQLVAHSELDDTLIETVCRGLDSQGRHVQAQALRTAIDTFEFERAHELLVQFIADHRTTSNTNTKPEHKA